MISSGNVDTDLVWVSLAIGGCTLFLITVLQQLHVRLRKWRSSARLPKGVVYPPHVHSFLPFIGSAIDMTNGCVRTFIEMHARRLQTPVFTATITGRKCLFIADSDLVYVVFKDHIREIDSLSLQKKAMIDVMGVPPSIVDDMFQNKKEFTKEAMAQVHKFLVADQELEKSIQQAQIVLWDHLTNKLPSLFVEDNSHEWKQVGMMDFCRQLIYSASVEPLVSKGMVSAELIAAYKQFDDGFPLLFANAPSFLTMQTRWARARIVQAFQSKEVHDNFSPFMQARRDLLQSTVGAKVFAKYNLGILLASVSNSIPGVFWTLYNIVTHPAAYQACREAVDQVTTQREPGRTWFSMEELDQLTVLHSSFQESLRLYQHFFIVRNVIDDFILKNPKTTTTTTGQTYMIEKGTQIMAFPHTVHMDPNIFANPETFQYDRFLDPKAKVAHGGGGLLQNYFKPFGGGAHLCPGRKFIGYETRALLAMLLSRLDLQLAPQDQALPPVGIQRQRQGASVAHPDRDPILEIRRRSDPR